MAIEPAKGADDLAPWCGLGKPGQRWTKPRRERCDRG